MGTGIFSTPSSIVSSVGSFGAAILLWVLGLALAFAGLFVWLEFGCMFPRSGGEKVYLEAVYQHPHLLATVVFATQAILLGFTGLLPTPCNFSIRVPDEELLLTLVSSSFWMYCFRVKRSLSCRCSSDRMGGAWDCNHCHNFRNLAS